MEELSQSQREELVRDLRALSIELATGLEVSADGDAPVDLDQPIGRVSRIDAIAQQELRKSSRRAVEQRLRLVKEALLRIDQGQDYGLCSNCEEPIDFRRLKARPESRRCLACQSSHERPR